MSEPIRLWGDRPFPPANAGPVPGIVYRLVHRQTPDYQFLHEPRVAHDGRTLFVNFSNAPLIESEPAQIMRGRRSRDNGATWSEPEIVAGGFADGRRRHETAPMLVREDGVYALVGRYDFGSKNALGMEVWRLDPATDRFAPVWPDLVAKDFIPFVAPQRREDGALVVGGHMDKVSRAAVAITRDPSLRDWTIVPIGTDIHVGYPETALMLEGSRVLAIVRPPLGTGVALAALSEDGGKRFGPLVSTDLPMDDSKPFAGRLSDGRGYLIWNQGEPRRNSLWLGLTAPGTIGPIERVWRLVGGHPAAVPADLGAIGETGESHEWAYPEAVERDGLLHVVVSLNKRHCYLVQFPLSALD